MSYRTYYRRYERGEWTRHTLSPTRFAEVCSNHGLNPSDPEALASIVHAWNVDQCSRLDSPNDLAAWQYTLDPSEE